MVTPALLAFDGAADTKPFRIKRIDAWSFRAPTKTPVSTSFGTMRDRPAVFLRIEDQDGCFGFGEIFANWPIAAAEYRVNLLAQDVAPWIMGREFPTPDAVFHRLNTKTDLVALQSGDYGAFRQVIAGIDIAVWDICARKAGLSLARYINAKSPNTVPAYASGIHIDAAPTVVADAASWGFDRFKVKVGFHDDPETDQVLSLISDLAAGQTVMADANQAWSLPAARRFLDGVQGSGLYWIEEPIRADASESDWQALMNHARTPIAAGENLAGFQAFTNAIKTRRQDVVQPDIAKWGGTTGCLTVARQALEHDQLYCPHFLGGGIGLIASAHLLAASASACQLEIDVNANPLRDAFTPVADTIENGHWPISDLPGLGITDIPKPLHTMQTAHQEIT